MTRWAVGLALLLTGCSFGDDGLADPGALTDREPGAQDNGQDCLFTGAGSTVCAGQVCLRLASRGSQGVCSESCDQDCRFGGTCVRLPDLAYNGRFVGDVNLCLLPCETLDDCPEQANFGCVPYDDVRICDEGPCVDVGTRAFCVPLPVGAPAADAGPG